MCAAGLCGAGAILAAIIVVYFNSRSNDYAHMKR